jgi:hypothetical protein
VVLAVDGARPIDELEQGQIVQRAHLREREIVAELRARGVGGVGHRQGEFVT